MRERETANQNRMGNDKESGKKTSSHLNIRSGKNYVVLKPRLNLLRSNCQRSKILMSNQDQDNQTNAGGSPCDHKDINDDEQSGIPSIFQADVAPAKDCPSNESFKYFPK